MRQTAIITLLLILTPAAALAQKKDIATARDYVKKGTNLAQAEQMMATLLADSANHDNERIWLTLFDAQRKQYEQINEKVYLHQPYDTAALFQGVRKMFATLESFDSLCARPDAKGHTRPGYRKKHADYLNTYRRNLLSGGAYYVGKRDYREAYTYYDMYIDCGEQPLFADYHYIERDSMMPQAAYWAVYCGYKMRDTHATLHHTYMALKDTAHYKYMLQYLAETYRAESDTARYIATLEEGFHKFPRFPFFFPRLIRHYTEAEQWDHTLALCDEALRADSTNTVFLVAKSSTLLSMGRYQECIRLSRDITALSDTLRAPYRNAGLAYYNQGVEAGKTTHLTRYQRQYIQELYRKALPYLERYRQLAPREKQVWGLPLYTIYLNLNMGKQFDEIDRLMK